MEKLYIIIPAYNEQDNIEEVVKDWYPIVEQRSEDSRLVIIDDGSKDETSKILKEFSKSNSSVKVVTLSRNFGQQSSLMCGFNYTVGDCVIELDVKPELPLEIIHNMIEKWKEGYDVVHAKNKCKKNPFTRFFTKIYLWFLRERITKADVNITELTFTTVRFSVVLRFRHQLSFQLSSLLLM